MKKTIIALFALLFVGSAYASSGELLKTKCHLSNKVSIKLRTILEGDIKLEAQLENSSKSCKEIQKAIADIAIKNSNEINYKVTASEREIFSKKTLFACNSYNEYFYQVSIPNIEGVDFSYSRKILVSTSDYFCP